MSVHYDIYEWAIISSITVLHYRAQHCRPINGERSINGEGRNLTPADPAELIPVN